MGQIITGHVNGCKTVSFTRWCKHCRCNFNVERRVNVSITSQGYGGSRAARQMQESLPYDGEIAFDQAATDLEQSRTHEGVVCPHCREFTTAATEYHFQNGELVGLSNKLKKRCVYAVLMLLLPNLLIAALLLLLNFKQQIPEGGLIILGSLCIFGVLLGVLALLPALLLLFTSLIALHYLKRAGQKITAPAIHAHLVDECLVAGNSLRWEPVQMLRAMYRLAKGTPPPEKAPPTIRYFSTKKRFSFSPACFWK